MKLFVSSAAIFVAVSLVCVGRAKADVIEVTSFVQGQAGTLGEPSFGTTPGQFNSALGTLTGVSLSYEIYLQSGVSLDASQVNANPGFYSVQNTLNVYTDYVTGGNAGQAFSEVSVPVPDSTVYIPANPSGVLFATSYVGTGISFSVNPLYLDSFTSDYSDFSPYIGFFPNSQLYPNAGSLTAGDDLDNLDIRATETFTYTPVPEPASFALLGSGLLAIVAAMRHRRNSLPT
jgi:hypothetical protein